MAEVLGAVFKLKRLWDEIKNVPKTIADLMMQIECLDPAIWEAETHFANTGLPPELWDDAAARKSANCCRIALQKLTDLVSDLAVQVNSARRMNSKLAYLKVLLKKDDLRVLEKRLETAVRMLQSAQNGYMITLLKLQPDIIVAKAFQQSRLFRQEMTNASLQHEATTRKFNLRVYNVRSKFSSVFTAAQNGYVEKLQGLFDNGKTSPFDQDTLGRTLAHCGAMGTSVDTLKLLVDMGISISDPDHNRW
ncbi:hypothetical protein PG990_003106 [Apiospora arundinis]